MRSSAPTGGFLQTVGAVSLGGPRSDIHRVSIQRNSTNAGLRGRRPVQVEWMIPLYLRSFEEVGQRGRFFCTTSAHTGVTKEPSPCHTGLPGTHDATLPRLFCSPQSSRHGPPWAAAPTANLKIFHVNATALSPNPPGPMRSSAPTGGLLHTVRAASLGGPPLNFASLSESTD